MQDLSEDELRKVFRSGLDLPEWAALRLVSKQWRALANSFADRVQVAITEAAMYQHTGGKVQPEERILMYWDECSKAAFSRLCYVL